MRSLRDQVPVPCTDSGKYETGCESFWKIKIVLRFFLHKLFWVAGGYGYPDDSAGGGQGMRTATSPWPSNPSAYPLKSDCKICKKTIDISKECVIMSVFYSSMIKGERSNTVSCFFIAINYYIPTGILEYKTPACRSGTPGFTL